MGPVCHRLARRGAWLLSSSLAAACAFDPTGGASAPATADGGGPVGSDGAAIGGAAPDLDGAVAAGCPESALLLACFLFDGTAVDGSGYGNTIQVNGSPAYTGGVVGDALDAGEGVDISIAETATLDGAAIRLFLDGVEVGSTAAGASLSGGGSSGTAVARNSPSGQYFDGQIDELRIWRRGAL